MSEFPITEQEEQLEALFTELEDEFKRLDRLGSYEEQHDLLEAMKGKIQDAKALIKEFEREARTDGIPAKELGKRKSELVEDLNRFISQRKARVGQLQSRQELMQRPIAENEPVTQELDIEGMSTQQIVATGRKEIFDIDSRLSRVEKVVDDTIQIGVQTAAELAEQTKQMETIVDDLDNIEFNTKRAGQVIRDLTRGLLTDKFIMCICLLICIGVVAIIALKIFDDDQDTLPKPREFSGSRRLLSMSAI